MRFGIEHTAFSTRNALITVLLLGTILVSSNTVNAATIAAGSGMTVIGSYSEGNDADGSYITLQDAGSTLLYSGDLASTLPDLDGTIIDGKVYIDPFTPTADILEVGGWYLSLSSLTIGTPDIFMSGSGLLYGNGYDSTAVDWTFSGGTSSYSMTITAVPVPAAVWLFGSGLVGLIAVARRKAA
jgi:hypothetical protein